MCLPVYEEFPKRIEKQWKDAEKANQNVDMISDDDDCINADTGRNLFKKRKVAKLYNGYGSEDDEEDSDEESDDDNGHEQNAFNQ